MALETVQLRATSTSPSLNPRMPSFYPPPSRTSTDDICRIGDLRLRLPKPIDNYNGPINATQVGPQCIQQPSLALRQDMPAEMLKDVVAALDVGAVQPMPGSEDCK